MAEDESVTLGAFASELLERLYERVGDPGAYGRIVQELLVAALRHEHPGLHDNRSAGTPDARLREGDLAFAWEIKHVHGGDVSVSERDIQGLETDPEAEARLVVLDALFPAQLWTLDWRRIARPPGALRPSAHPAASRTDETRRLARDLEAVLRRTDLDLLAGGEVEAKALVQERVGA